MDAFIDKGKCVKQQTLNELVKKREPVIIVIKARLGVGACDV